MRMMSQASVLAGALAGMLVMPLSPAHAQADFYKGKTVAIVIGAKTGSLAVAAQVVGRHLGKHIPGNPTVINRQMPGGAHLNATNNIFNVAERRRPDHPGGQSERGDGPAREAAERPVRCQQVHLARLVRP